MQLGVIESGVYGLGRARRGLVPPAGLEPTHPAPEAGALSAELRGRPLTIIYQLRRL